MWNFKFASEFKFNSGRSSSNRVALAPMTNGQSHEDGTLSEAELHWLTMRAEGGFGVIITCASHVQANAQAWAGELGCFSDSQIPGLEKIAQNCKKNGALSILQIFHGGVRSPRRLTGVQPTAPSEVQLDFPGFETPRALEDFEIEKIIQNFVQAAQRAHKAGMSGIEVHGANGYLFTQFLSTINNKRTDKWGGSLENRARLLLNTVTKIRKAVPADFIVGVRLLAEDNSKGEKGFDIDETLQVTKWLGELGIDYLHISAGDIASVPWKYPSEKETTIHRIRAALPKSIALMAVGGVKTAADAEFALNEGADFVAIGKVAISTPDWPKQAVLPGFTPKAFPLPKEDFQKAGVSPGFLEYLHAFKLVKD